MSLERYSKINYPTLRQVKKSWKKSGFKIDYFMDKIKEAIYNSKHQDLDIRYNEYTLIGLLLENKFNNYFIISPELTNFFKNTEIKEDYLNSFNDIIRKNYTHKDNRPENMIKVSDKITASIGGYFFSGAIYTKTENRTIFFTLSTNNENKAYLFCSNGDDVSNLPLYGDKKDRSNLHCNTYHGEMMRIVLNMIFYMSAFPENVLNSPPDEECDKLNKNNSKTISISKTISEYLNENRDVSPHLRRGHFRFLGSDHFTKKRGQTVFVKASFIRGEAKTII